MPKLPERRHTADSSGSTQIFRYDRRWPVGTSIVCLVIGGLCLVTGVAGLVSASLQFTVGGSLAVLGSGLVFAWLGIRAFRMGVKVSSGRLIIRNELRTRVVNGADIRAITVEKRSFSNTSDCWMARVHLADGSSIWIDGLDYSPDSKPPKPELTTSVEEIRMLLGVGDADIAPQELPGSQNPESWGRAAPGIDPAE